MSMIQELQKKLQAKQQIKYEQEKLSEKAQKAEKKPLSEEEQLLKQERIKNQQEARKLLESKLGNPQNSSGNSSISNLDTNFKVLASGINVVQSSVIPISPPLSLNIQNSLYPNENNIPNSYGIPPPPPLQLLIQAAQTPQNTNNQIQDSSIPIPPPFPSNSIISTKPQEAQTQQLNKQNIPQAPPLIIPSIPQAPPLIITSVPQAPPLIITTVPQAPPLIITSVPQAPPLIKNQVTQASTIPQAPPLNLQLPIIPQAPPLNLLLPVIPQVQVLNNQQIEGPQIINDNPQQQSSTKVEQIPIAPLLLDSQKPQTEQNTYQIAQELIGQNIKKEQTVENNTEEEQQKIEIIQEKQEIRDTYEPSKDNAAYRETKRIKGQQSKQVGKLFGINLSKRQLNSYFDSQGPVMAESPWNTFRKLYFKTINSQLRTDEFPEQTVLYFKRLATVVDALDGYVQNKSNDTNLKKYRSQLEEVVIKKEQEILKKSQEQQQKPTGPQLDMRLYSKILKSIQSMMATKSEENKFEECIQLRDCIKKIEKLKSEIEEDSDSKSKESKIVFLNTELGLMSVNYSQEEQ